MAVIGTKAGNDAWRGGIMDKNDGKYSGGMKIRYVYVVCVM